MANHFNSTQKAKSGPKMWFVSILSPEKFIYIVQQTWVWVETLILVHFVVSWIHLIILCGICYSSEYLYVTSLHHPPQYLNFPLSLYSSTTIYSETDREYCFTTLYIYTKRTNTHTHTDTHIYNVTLRQMGQCVWAVTEGAFSLGNRFIGLFQPFVCNPQHT